MLPEKPWKTEAILRLLARIVICIVLGTLAVTVIQFFEEPKHAHPGPFAVSVVAAFGALAGGLFLLRPSWTIDNFTRRYLGLIACLALGLSLTWWGLHSLDGKAASEPSTLRIVAAVLGFQGAAVVLVSVFLREQGTDWVEGFGLNVDWRTAVIFGLVFAPCFLPVGWGLQWASGHIMEHLRLQAEEQTAVEVLRNSESSLDSLVLGIAAVLLAPVAEETIFRGILYPAIKQRGFPQLALWGTSIAFGAIHLNLAALLPLIVLAVLLTKLYEKTGNLLAPIVAHSLFNALGFMMVYILPDKPGHP